MSLLVGITASLSGAALGAWARRRKATTPLREAVRRSSIAELSPGRFAVRGRVIPTITDRSVIDGARCVFLERAEPVSSGLLRALEHTRICHRFFLEDETGRIEVDPARVEVETSAVVDETGRVAERRLRAGEEVEVVCEVRAAGGADATGAAALAGYRDGASRVEIDYEAPGSPAIVRDTVDLGDLEVEAHGPGRVAAGAMGAALFGWGVALVLWTAAFSAAG